MVVKPSKKGPHRVKTAQKPETAQQLDDRQLDARIEAFIRKTHGAIKEARTRMTDEQVEKADKEAAAILKSASDGAKAARRRA